MSVASGTIASAGSLSLGQINASWQSLPDLPQSLLTAGASATDLYVAPAPTDGGRVLTVGAGQEYATLAQAVAASQDGDVIEIEAGTYVNDTAIVNHKITIEGVGGMVNLVETQPLANEKGILVINNDATIANIIFSGAWIPDSEGADGAGIRYQGGNLTVVNDVFTGNQDGLMGNPVDGLPSNNITIENSTFANNGVPVPGSPGYGYTHDAYIGFVGTATVTNSVFAGNAGVGHELKDRAQVSNISNNVIADVTSAASYTVDLPDGGNATLTGNYIQQSAQSPNWAIIDYAGEAEPYVSNSLTLTGNTIVNQSTSASPVLVRNPSNVTAQITGNTIVGLTEPEFSNGPFVATNNVNAAGQKYADSNPSQLVPAGFIKFTDSAPHTVTLAKGGVIGGAGLLTVHAIAGKTTTEGGSGGLIYSEGTNVGGSRIVTAPGSTNRITLEGQDTVQSQGNDLITVGTQDTNIIVTGTAAIASGSATNTYTVNGSATVTGGNGNDFITVGNGASLVVSGHENFLKVTERGGSVVIDANLGQVVTSTSGSGSAGSAATFAYPQPATNGGKIAANNSPSMQLIVGTPCQDSVTGGSVVVQWQGQGFSFTSNGGLSQSATIQLGSEADTVTSNEADTIYAGSGDDLIILEGGGQTVYANSGTLTIGDHGVSANAKATVYGDGGDYTFTGDTGNIIYVGGSLASTIEAQLSNLILEGGSGHLTVNGGSRETITGGSGGITLNGGAADTITTAAGAADSIKLSGPSTVYSYGTDQIDLGGALNQNVTAYGTASISDALGVNHITLLGDDTLTTGGGSDTISVGAGASASIATSALTFLTETDATVGYAAVSPAQDSTATVTGSATISSGPATPLTIRTVAGQSTTVTLGSGNAQVTLAGDDTLTFGSGSAVVTDQRPAGMAELFRFVLGSGGGTDVIKGFRAGIDQLSFQGVGVQSQTVSGGNTMLTLTDGTHVQLNGVVGLSFS